MIQKIEMYPLSAVRVCPLNPRKRINPADIEEMAESILESGILQPPIARWTNPTKGDRAEIVFGQRRFLGNLRAVELAQERKLPGKEGGDSRAQELLEIGLIVRVLSDRQVVEEALVENLQRVDVSVREEAEGFSELLALRDEEGEPVYDQAKLARKLGKSVAFLSQRLKLKHVPELMWEALESGQVSIRHLELVGTIADGKARLKAAKEIINPKLKAEPLTTREAARLITEEYRVSLKGVPWDTKDVELVPEEWSTTVPTERVRGGSCEDCPHRAGNVLELQGDLAMLAEPGKGTKKGGFDPRVCLLPSCFRAKEEALWRRMESEAIAGGQRVLTADEAGKVFASWGGELQTERESGMVALKAKPDFFAVGHHGTDDLRTWEEYLAETEVEREVIIAKHPETGSVLRLIDRERAIKLAEVRLKEIGEVSPFGNRPKPPRKTAAASAGTGGATGPAPLSEWQMKRQVDETTQRATLLRVRAVVNEIDGLSTEQVTELVLGVMLETVIEVDQMGPLMTLLSLLGYVLPEKLMEQELPEILAVLRSVMAEDVDPTGKAKMHIECWLVILTLLSSYEAMESPSGLAFLGKLGVDAAKIRSEAREGIVKADLERLEREREELKAKESAKAASKKTPEAVEKSPEKVAKTVEKPAKKALKSPKKAVSKGKSAEDEVIWRFGKGKSEGIAHAYLPEDELRPFCKGGIPAGPVMAEKPESRCEVCVKALKRAK